MPPLSYTESGIGPCFAQVAVHVHVDRTIKIIRSMKLATNESQLLHIQELVNISLSIRPMIITGF